jgi:large subunit ribosomal protein L25
MQLKIQSRVQRLEEKKLNGVPGKSGVGVKAVKSQIRASGYIPAVIYNGKGINELISIEKQGFESNLREMKKEGKPLATTLFTLSDGRKAIVKEVQYHVADYSVEHVDLFAVDASQKLKVNVPVKIDGAFDCIGLKAGGFLRQVSRKVKVSCKPDAIPVSINVDISKLEVLQSIKVKDVSLEKGVNVLTSLEQVIVTIAKKK